MKRVFFFSLLGLFFLSFLSAQPTQWKWAKQYGSGDYENILDIATDADGNVYGVGYLYQTGATTNTIIFGSTTLTTGGGKDGFVAKWDSLGSLKWIKQFKNAEDASVNRVVCDSLGNVFIAGDFLGTIDVGGISLNAANTNTNFGNGFWAKLNPVNGTAIWAKKLNLSTSENSYVKMNALCIDKAGNIYLGGAFGDELKGAATVSINAAGLKDGFVAQSSNTGQINWIRAYNGGSGDVDNQAVVDIVADKNGGLIVGGNFFNFLNIGGSNQYSLEHTPFVAKMNITNGVNSWFQIGNTVPTGFSASDNTLKSIALDSMGNVYACGDFGMNISWGTTTLSNKDITNYYSDFYVVKMSNSGNVAWVKSWGGAAFDEKCNDIIVNKDGSYYIAGDYGSATDFGAGIVLAVGGQGYSSAYLAKYTSAGNLTWLRTVGNTTDPENGFFKCIQSDRFGNIFAGAEVQSETFHYENNVFSQNVSSGNSDIGIAKLKDKTITITNVEGSLYPFQFNVFPNPCIDNVIIEWEEVGSMILLNTYGQVISYYPLTIGKNAIALSPTLPKGVYWLQLESTKGRFHTKIVIE